VIFKEVQPNENFDLRRFASEPTGRVEVGALKMLWGKARVRLALQAEGISFVSLDYWGGEQATALFLLGYIVGICAFLPETIGQAELQDIFPLQHNKELGAEFWSRLYAAGALTRTRGFER
jgi:hypothetical protein